MKARSVLDGREAWRDRWTSLDVHRRRRISRAVSRGKPVAERRDASLAVGLAARQRRLLPWLFPLFFVLRMALALLFAPLFDRSPLALLASPGTWLESLIFAALFAAAFGWFQGRRLRAADQANRAMLDRRRR